MKHVSGISGGVLLLVVAAALSALLVCSGRGPVSDPALAFAHVGAGRRVEVAYRAWRERDEAAGGKISVRLGWSKAFSTEFTRATGRATIDPERGTLRVEVAGLEDPKAHEVWLVDDVPGPGKSARPETGDRTLKAGTLVARGSKGILEADLRDRLAGFEVDAVVVTRAGTDPTSSGLLFGTASLFQRMARSAREGEGKGGATDLDRLVAKGADLFFNETFAGNGRTCGSCHPSENNLTIDPAFIATLPARDPLFVAEFVPELARNFEKPELMRKAGLILENVDGFDDLETRFVLRGVPHTLAMSTSITAPPPTGDEPVVLPAERTGWSGDGAPGSGTLREFANGAVRQHFTKTLRREPGTDFRFATEEELDAIEAFTLALGRDEDPDELEDVRFRSPLVARGRDIFEADDAEGGTVAAGKCDQCHAEAGASVSFVPGGFNFNFDTGVERIPDSMGDLIDAPSNPPDGGLGSAPNPGGGFGDGTFNTPSLVEAADTPPFFHNNAIGTLEEAVGFYNSAAFNNSPAGRFLADPRTGVAIRLDATQVAAVAAFLRVMNALENIRSSTEFAVSAKEAGHARAARALLRLAIADARDGVEVLECAGLHPAASTALREAVSLLGKASDACFAFKRRARIERALRALERAQEDMVEGPSPHAGRGERGPI